METATDRAAYTAGPPQGGCGMKIDVYAEELTTETELVTKTVTDDRFGTRTFYGLRFFMASPPELHDDPEDDDQSAITLWIPWTRTDGHNFSSVTIVLNELLERLSDAWMQSKQLEKESEV